MIAGFRPGGLALGAELKQFGISAITLERLEAGANSSRAAVVHARTLEVLGPLGVTPERLDNGVIVPIFHVRDRSRIRATVSFKQDRTEAILLRRLQSLGAAVKRPCEVVSNHPAENEVAVQFRRGGELKIVRTKWLVGCDGAHRLVREQAGIPCERGAYEGSFLLADVGMDWPIDREEVSLSLPKKIRSWSRVARRPLPHRRHRRTGSPNAVRRRFSADSGGALAGERHRSQGAAQRGNRDRRAQSVCATLPGCEAFRAGQQVKVRPRL
jgi:2-polyprenyl-6-methoxyphenol hydroxylase-like FAD-dependent oxidoreductase